MNHLESLTKKLHALLPELLELKKGCIFTIYGGELKMTEEIIRAHGAQLLICNTAKMSYTEIERWRIPKYKTLVILGRPINLEDILKALGGIEGFWAGFLWTGDRYAFTVDRSMIDKVLWKLGLPLDQQSPETIEWLDNLIPEQK